MRHYDHGHIKWLRRPYLTIRVVLVADDANELEEFPETTPVAETQRNGVRLVSILHATSPELLASIARNLVIRWNGKQSTQRSSVTRT